MGSVSKKVRKEPPPDSSCSSQDVENELPSEDDSKFLEDLEDKMKGQNSKGGVITSYTVQLLCLITGSEIQLGCKSFYIKISAVFNNPRVQGKKTILEKLGEVVDVLKKGTLASDQDMQLVAVLFMTRLLKEKGAQEKNSMRNDSAQTVR